MHSNKLQLFASVATLSSLTYAHVKLVTPVPYGASSLNTNPLLDDGSDWPCKQRDGWDTVTKWNVMPVGQQQTISFQGQATHGGGACQVSLTTDNPPTKDSTFKVIKSIEGGCPSTNPGNVGVNPFGFGADKFNFAIPDSVKPGNYSLAWTWFNKIGNREMYMNCAPVTVTSSGKRDIHSSSDIEKRDGIEELPTMFRANSGNGCSTAASGTVLEIPAANLGKVVQRIGNEPLTPPVGNCGPGSPAEGGQGSSPASPAAGSAGVSPVQPSAQTPSVLVSPAASPIQSSAQAPPAAAPPTASPVQPSAQAPPAAASPTVSPVRPSTAPSPPSSSNTTGSGAANPGPGGSTGTCSTPGKSVCSPDGKSWGDCMENHQVIFQPVAPGTKCDPALGVEVPLTKARAFKA
ncbi:MAG: hypothetical protein Q9191_008298 [Dirinaria sp. TL-2023a]